MPEIQLSLLDTQLGTLHTAMDQVRTAAALDFGPITQLVKNHFSNPAHDGELRKHFAAMVHELQYYDMLHQSIDHIQELHQRLRMAMTHPANRPEKNKPVTYSLTQLNRLQFDVSCLGLTRASNEILHLINLTPAENVPDTSWFSNQATVRALAAAITEQFHNLATLCDRWPAADVQPRLDELNALYSTATERAVLGHFMKEPGISAARIAEALYQHTESSAIDLFE